MNSRIMMGLSAVALGLAGLAATFAPGELLDAAGVAADPPTVLLVQVAGALYLGFAMMNWMARGSLIGGIYGRPVALGNLTHFVVVSFALLRATFAAPTIAVAAATAVYVVFAVWFAFVAFTHPVKTD